MTRPRFASWLPVTAVLALAAFGIAGLTLGIAGDRKGMQALPDSAGSTVDVLLDPAAALSREEVLARPDSDWLRWDGRGYIRALYGEAVWVRFVLKNPAPHPVRGVLADAEYYTDRIDLWTPDAASPDGWRHQVSGEWIPAHEKSLWGRDAAFFVEIPANGERLVYLRLQDHFGVWLRPVWWTEERTFLSAQIRDIVSEACYFGMLLALLAYNCVIWARLRHRDLGHYLGYLSAGGVFMFFSRSAHQVVGFSVGSPTMETVLTTALAAGGFFLVQFAREFLDLARLTPRMDWVARVMRILMGTLLVSLTLPWSNNTLLLHLTVGAFSLTHIVLFAAAVQAWRAGSYYARYFVLSFGVLLGGVLPTAAIWLLAIPLGMSAHAMRMGSALEMLLLSLALADRFARLQRDTLAARLSEESARLETLRYQLNPHFLYNVLGSIRSLVHSRPAAADAMTMQLADFCRLTLTRDAATTGTLGDELKLISTYLDMERTRWRDRLDTRIDAEPSALAVQVPPFLLLPLVENAIKYGTRTSEETVRVILVARLETTAAGTLLIEVANTGRWVNPSDSVSDTSTGIGLSNLRQRLARYYPDRHTFTTGEADGWVRVTLRLALNQNSSSKQAHAQGALD